MKSSPGMVTRRNPGPHDFEEKSVVWGSEILEGHQVLDPDQLPDQ
jgi:hypothetical protein